jgi:hypothetical protein
MAIRLLVGLGVGVVSFIGVKAGVEFAKAQVVGLISGAGAWAVQWVGFLNIDKVITLLFSALLVRWVLKGLDKATDSMKSGSWKPPTAAP